MNQLGQYRDDRGLDNDAVAEQLTALLGKKISPASVHLWSSRPKPPKAWAQALGLSDEAPPQREDGDFFTTAEPPLTAAGDTAEPGHPSPPPGTRFTPPASAAGGGDYAVVRDRIQKFYGAIGAGVSMVSQNPGYGDVTDAYSGDLADAWIAAARQNQNVAKIIAFLESGGPVGELVIAHLILVGGMVYVSGRGPGLDFLYAGKFSAHRQLAATRIAAESAADDFDASRQNGSANPVAHAAAASGS